MAILVGIDEAGFGPILGPLVVSSSAFRLPDNLIWANHWEILRASVSDKRTSLKGRLLIVDSKKAFTRTIGIKHLRRTVLAALKHLGSEPKNLTELISSLCPDCLEHIAEYPWYKKAGDYQLGGDDGGYWYRGFDAASRLCQSTYRAIGIKEPMLGSSTLQPYGKCG